ncbi:polar amino acid transport system ATP-binding protein [Arthrobacter sp. UYCu712]
MGQGGDGDGVAVAQELRVGVRQWAELGAPVDRFQRDAGGEESRLGFAVGVQDQIGARPDLDGARQEISALRIPDRIGPRHASPALLIGPSGSGKTTFLRCINHLEKVDAGRLYVDEHLVGYSERNGRLYEMKERQTARSRLTAGMVFQRFNLFSHMTVLENIVEAPVYVLGRPRNEVTAEAQTLLDRVGLGNRGHSYPQELSGGQQQRIAIARTLAMKPKLMLFDEPTSAPDPGARR